MKIQHCSLIILFLFCSSFFGPGLYPAPGGQQVDLVKMKKEEEKRKKKLKKTKYVVTNDSLKNVDKTKGTGSLSKTAVAVKTGKKANESTSQASPPPQQQASMDTINSASEEMDKERDEKCKYWQGLKRDLIYEIYKTKADIRDMLLEHNKLVKEFDLAVGDEQNKMMERIDKLSKDINDAKNHITATEKEMVELEDKARKAGVLPGCLREIEYPPSNK